MRTSSSSRARRRGLVVLAVLASLAVTGSAMAQTPALVNAASPGVTIGPAHPAVTVPVNLSRDDTSRMLGFSVRIQLSPEFSTLDPNLDVAIGNFLTDGGRATQLQVIVNGGGSYTVDGVTLGADCGPTAQTGTLFTVTVRSTAASGTGTVTIQSVTLRDCSNQTILADPGSAASVSIDNTPPAATVASPNGGESWVHQTTHDITWSASDAAGVTGVDLDYSTDGGATWTSIATGEANDGVYAWAIPNTPTSNARVRVTAHDANGNSASDASDASFTILSNSPPVLGAIGNRSVNELALLTFTATATDAESPPQALAFSLDPGAPAGAAIDPGTGVFTWTPTEAQGPGSYPITVRVTDNGTPPLSAFETITVTVAEVNVAPALSGVPATATIPEQVLDTFTATATDPDIPVQTLTFSLVGAPTGASIDGATGVFTWTPTEAQGPGDYPFTVRVTDGVANTDAAIVLHVTETNTPPALSGVPASVSIPELVPYTFTATANDPDIPVQALTFSLVGGPPGAAIDGVTGVFTWTPTEAQGPGVYPFAVRVSDGVANTDAPITITVTEVTIAAISDLGASIVRSGNDTDGTTKVLLTWTATPGGTTVAVYRARFGGYPEYDDAGGAAPPTPSDPPSAPWELTGVTAPGQTDEVNVPSGPGGRDDWTYVGFVHGAGANVSGPSNEPATPNYLLGDVSDGTPEGQGRGNNVVDAADVSALGAAYGLTGPSVAPVAYLDFGPTSDHTVNGRPLTDNAIDFEDLVILAMNYGTGPAPQARPAAVAAAGGTDELTVESPAAVTAGEEFTVKLRLSGSGRLQALSTVLGWKAGMAEPIGASGSAWLASQNGVALSPGPGAVDVALLGLRGRGLAAGEIAEVRFRALAAGDPQVTVAGLRGRDGANRAVEVGSTSVHGEAPRAVATGLEAAYPNPFREATTVGFALAAAGEVRLTVYGVDGRAVRTLASGRWEAGPHRLTWDGRDDQGRAVSAGIYFVHLASPQGRFTKRISYLK